MPKLDRKSGRNVTVCVGGKYRCQGYGCHFTDAELRNAGYPDRQCELGAACPCLKSCEHGEQCPSYRVQKRA
jgi:hypothetical protein